MNHDFQQSQISLSSAFEHCIGSCESNKTRKP